MIEHEAKLQTNIDGIRVAVQKSNRAVKLAKVGNHERKLLNKVSMIVLENLQIFKRV